MISKLVPITILLAASLAGMAIGCSSDPNPADGSGGSGEETSSSSSGAGGDPSGSGGAGNGGAGNGGAGNGGAGGQGVQAAYSYQFGIPNDVSLADGDVKVWNAPADGGESPPSCDNWNQVLLIVAPNADMTRGVRTGTTGLMCRGVILIGATIRAEGGPNPLKAPTGTDQFGSDIFKIVFAQGAPKRPFVFFANIDFDVVNSTWGDMFGVSTALNGNKDNYDQWVDATVEKMLVRNGHYFWTAPNDNEAPHSDIWQSKYGGWRQLRIANSDLRWLGQTIFAVGPGQADKLPHPEGLVDLKQVMFRHMPPNNNIYTNGTRGFVYLSNNNSFFHPSTGQYYAFSLEGVFAEKAPWQDLGKHVSTENPAGETVQGNKLIFGQFMKAPQIYPIFGGDSSMTFAEPPTPVLDEAHVGKKWRVTTAAELRAIFSKP